MGGFQQSARGQKLPQKTSFVSKKEVPSCTPLGLCRNNLLKKQGYPLVLSDLVQTGMICAEKVFRGNLATISSKGRELCEFFIYSFRD